MTTLDITTHVPRLLTADEIVAHELPDIERYGKEWVLAGFAGELPVIQSWPLGSVDAADRDEHGPHCRRNCWHEVERQYEDWAEAREWMGEGR